MIPLSPAFRQSRHKSSEFCRGFYPGTGFNAAVHVDDARAGHLQGDADILEFNPPARIHVFSGFASRCRRNFVQSRFFRCRRTCRRQTRRTRRCWPKRVPLEECRTPETAGGRATTAAIRLPRPGRGAGGKDIGIKMNLDEIKTRRRDLLISASVGSTITATFRRHAGAGPSRDTASASRTAATSRRD